MPRDTHRLTTKGRPVTSFSLPEPDPSSVARLAVTLHRLDEAHRRYRVHAAHVVGIDPTELSALLAISDSPGMTSATLSQDIVLDFEATTSVVDRLEASSHIRSATHPDSSRSLHLTDTGAHTMLTLRTAYRYLLSTTGTDQTISSALSQLDSITYTLNTAARKPDSKGSADTPAISPLLGIDPDPGQ